MWCEPPGTGEPHTVEAPPPDRRRPACGHNNLGKAGGTNSRGPYGACARARGAEGSAVAALATACSGAMATRSKREGDDMRTEQRPTTLRNARWRGHTLGLPPKTMRFAWASLIALAAQVTWATWALCPPAHCYAMSMLGGRPESLCCGMSPERRSSVLSGSPDSTTGPTGRLL